MTRRSRYASHLQNLRANPAVSLWEKNPYRLSPAPETASAAFRESFEQALGWAEEGLWSSAASAFELLAAGRVPGCLPTGIAGCAACGWRIMTGRSPRCGDTSRAPSRRPTPSIWKRSVS